MKKVLKKIVKILLWVVVIILAAVLTLPLWFGPVGKLVANSVVPSKVGADFNLGHLSLNPYTGKLEVGDMQLANPTGHEYSEKNAVSLGLFRIDMGMTTLASDVVHIEDVTITDLIVAVGLDEEGTLNFDRFQYNLAGGEENYRMEQEKQQEAANAKSGKDETKVEEKEMVQEESGKGEKKFIIDHFEIDGIKVIIGKVSIPLPQVVLTDIGKKSNGATLAEVYEQVFDQVENMIGSVGEGAKALQEFATQQAAAAARKAQEFADMATSAAADTAKQAQKAAADKAKQAQKAAADAAKQAQKAATDAFSDATNSVKDGASQAIDSFKKLF